MHDNQNIDNKYLTTSFYSDYLVLVFNYPLMGLHGWFWSILSSKFF